LGAFENKISATTGHEVGKKWRILHSEELHNVYAYSSPRIGKMVNRKRMKWSGGRTNTEKTRNGHKYFRCRQPHGERPVVR
jgi:hypothetical protein